MQLKILLSLMRMPLIFQPLNQQNDERKVDQYNLDQWKTMTRIV